TPMTIFDRLEQEHDEVKDLFKQLAKANEEKSPEAQSIFDSLRDQLLAHAKAEERTFYPRLAELSAVEDDEKEKALVAEAREEHGVAETLIYELSSMDSSDEQWQAKCAVLQENVEHHIKEEEGPLFRRAKRLLAKEDAEAIEREFMKEKQGV